MRYRLSENVAYIIQNAKLTGTYTSDTSGETVVTYNYKGYSESRSAGSFEDAIDKVAEAIETDIFRSRMAEITKRKSN